MKKTTYEFCLRILSLGVHCSKPLVNLVMSLCGHKARSVAELSESPVYRYQYSSIYKCIDNLASDDKSFQAVEREVIDFCFRDYVDTPSDGTYELKTDKTPIAKPHSPTHSDRRVIAVPNCVNGVQRPLDVGHELSVVGLYIKEAAWMLPLSFSMIPSQKTPSEVAVEQIRSLMEDKSLPLQGASLVSNAADSGYATATYIDGVKDIDNLVSIVRFRSGSKVYAPQTSSSKTIYGQKYYLYPETKQKHYKKHPKTQQPYSVEQLSITERAADKVVWREDQLKNGRKVRVRIRQWNDVLLRTKQHIKMSDKPFNLIMVEVFDAQSNELVFTAPLFLAVFGPKRHQLDPLEVYQRYRHRFGLEGMFRFCKQQLLLEGYQAASLQAFKNWSLVVLIAMWMLFSARNDLIPKCPKWQKYDEAKRKKTAKTDALSMAQVKKAILPLLLSFDPRYFMPKKSKPGKGRTPGTKMKQKKRYPYVKKQTKASPKYSNTG